MHYNMVAPRYITLHGRQTQKRVYLFILEPFYKCILKHFLTYNIHTIKFILVYIIQ